MNEKDFQDIPHRPDSTFSSVDFRKICNILWFLKYWLLFSIIVCISVAYIYISRTTPIYKKSITILFNNQQDQYSNNSKLISNALGIKTNTLVDDQVFILSSEKLMERVVERGFFNVRYFSISRFKEEELYTSSPLIFSFIPEKKYENAYINITVNLTPNGKVIIQNILINNSPISVNSNTISLDQVVTTPMGSFSFTARENVDIKNYKDELRITQSSIKHTAKTFASWLKIAPASKQSDVLLISITDYNPKRAEDILKLLVDEYNNLTKLNDSQSIMGTITFLDERLFGLENELNHVEGTYTNYRSANELMDIQSQSQIAMHSDKQYKERLNDLSLQLSILDIVKKHLTNDSIHKLIPVNLGFGDGSFNSTIEQYNQLVIDRNRMLAGSSDINPKVQSVTVLLNTLKANIIQSARNLEMSYNLQLQTIHKQIGSNQYELASMPAKQLALTRMSRLHQVKEPLYVLLQQKREEALLMLSSLSEYAKVVNGPFGLDTPIKPEPKNIYLMAILIALMVPIGFVSLMNLSRRKILFEKDIIDRCSIQVLGVIPKAPVDKKATMKVSCVTNTGRDSFTESFRMLRSKFQYHIIDERKPGAYILQITSSGAKEGKSFLSVNMALSLAYLGKKILLIGADLRKPTLHKYLAFNNNSDGLSDFLAGNIPDIHTIITRSSNSDYLDVILPGHIPPNPSELLSHAILSETLDTLRKEYDYIIVDSAPFLMVSDGFLVSKAVDGVLFVVRSGFTKLSCLDTLQNMYKEGNFNSVMIVLNSVDFSRNARFGVGVHGYGYGYSYGYGAGYGAGYGYGYDYGNDEKSENKKKKEI